MSTIQTPPVVAILNTNDDLVEMLRTSFEKAGLVAVSAHLDDVRRGSVNLKDFVEEHDPRVVVYDLTSPYDIYYRYLEHIRAQPFFAGREIVVTSTNERRATELIGHDVSIFEIVGRPFDIDQLTDVVRQAARARPTR